MRVNIRIIRVAEDYPAAGNPQYGLQPVFYYLSKEQAASGYDVHVIARGGSDKKQTEYYDNVCVHRVSEPFGARSIGIVSELAKTSPRHIIHTHATSGLSLGILHRMIDSPIVSHIHGTTISRHMPVELKFGDLKEKFSLRRIWYYYFREKILWSRANRLITVSDKVNSDLQSYYKIKSSKIYTVYNGVDTQIFKPSVSIRIPEGLDVAHKRVVLYVGHFGPRKGILFLIQAMKKVAQEIANAVLLCIGGTPKWLGREVYWNILVSAIRSNQLEGKVHLLDKVPNNVLPLYYNLADIFVLPSYYESFAKVVIEAMACAKPVVATKEGGASEIVTNRKTGFLIDYGSPDQMAKAIVTLLQDENLSKRMGANGRKRVESDFTWKAVTNRIGKVYDEILIQQ